MRIGMIGLGKLGLPCAVAIAMKGHDVMGYDLDESRMSYAPQPYREAGPDGTGDFNDYLKEFRPVSYCDDDEVRYVSKRGNLRFGTCKEVVQHADILFVAVQTPHDPRYEGITRLPKERVDFDYSHLRAAVQEIAQYANHDAALVIISTVLPGTMRREIMPILKGTPDLRHLKLCYNPFFIAMGTTMRDFLNPEFVLFGNESDWAAEKAKAFYMDILSKHEGGTTTFPCPFYSTRIENAELIKVAYNTMISSKISFANTLMEMCHKLPNCDVDEVTNGLALANWRLWSPAYTKGGMGDGGGCHPRDNIALSWLSRELDLKFDLFDALMTQREKGTEFLAEMCHEHVSAHPTWTFWMLGIAFKENTNLTVGSPALLLREILYREYGVEVDTFDPHVWPERQWGKGRDDGPEIIFVGCRHAEFASYEFNPGSVVIDPWRYLGHLADVDGVTYVPVGVGPRT